MSSFFQPHARRRAIRIYSYVYSSNSSDLYIMYDTKIKECVIMHVCVISSFKNYFLLAQTKIYGLLLLFIHAGCITISKLVDMLLGQVKKQTCLASPPASFLGAAWILFLFLPIQNYILKTVKCQLSHRKIKYLQVRNSSFIDCRSS